MAENMDIDATVSSEQNLVTDGITMPTTAAILAAADPSLASAATENATAKDPLMAAAQPQITAAPQVTEAPTELTELQKYWKTVNENPTDFTGWTYLLQYVEQQNNIDEMREAFDAFLKRYPYCYGYWKKFAENEKKHGNIELAERVFEQGVVGIPLSIDLWLHYVEFAQNKYEGMPEKEAVIRRLFERAVMAAGTDFRSDRLWEQYISWEEENKDLKRVTALFDRVLAVPTQCYSRHYERFYKHVKDNHPKDILTLDEFLRLRKEVVPKDVEAVETEDGNAGDAAPPGLDAPPPGLEAPPPGAEENATGDAPVAPADAVSKADEAEVPALREKVLEIRRKIHKANEEEVSKRWYHEEGIRRPYFHVKPLEKSQLKSWREYLDYEISHGSHERVLILFERCLIACALYEEFWMKYAKYLETYTVDGVRNVFRRACTVHLPKKPNLYLAWAAFEERQGNHQQSTAILDSLEQQVPGLLMVALRKISLERRQGNFNKTNEMFESCISSADSQTTKSFYIVKYARYLSKVLGNLDKAKDVLEEALKADKDNPKLYLQLLDIEYQQSALNEPSVLSIFDKAISSSMALEHRVTFSQRRMEFLEDFGSNISRLVDAYDEHQKLTKEMQNDGKKRKADSTPEESAKKAKKEEATPTTNGTTDTSGYNMGTGAMGGQQDASGMYNYNQGWGGYNMQQPNPYGYHQGWGSYGQYY